MFICFRHSDADGIKKNDVIMSSAIRGIKSWAAIVMDEATQWEIMSGRSMSKEEIQQVKKENHVRICCGKIEFFRLIDN